MASRAKSESEPTLRRNEQSNEHPESDGIVRAHVWDRREAGATVRQHVNVLVRDLLITSSFAATRADCKWALHLERNAGRHYVLLGPYLPGCSHAGESVDEPLAHRHAQLLPAVSPAAGDKRQPVRQLACCDWIFGVLVYE